MKIHTKRRKANNNEPWIGELLDEVSEDKLLEMSAIPTDIPLPLPNQEKLARTVIDKADVFDEQERERRKQYEKAYCRKQFLRATLIVGVIVCAFIALYLGGVFDNVLLDHYNYRLESMVVQNCESEEQGAQVDVDKLIQAGFFGDAGVTGKQTKDLADEDELENTAYKVAEDYCKRMSNDYAIDDCKVVRLFDYKDTSDPAVTKEGGSVKMCEIVATFMKIDRTGKLAEQASQPLTPLKYGKSNPWSLSDYLTKDLEQVIPSDRLTKKQASVVFLIALDD